MQIHDFFLQLVVILLSARILGEFAAKLNIPSVIGELSAGILLGPSLFNIIEPTETIKLLAELGIIFLLFEVGIETNIARLTKTGIKPFIVALGGVVMPFILGFVTSYLVFDLSLIISLFVACTLTATSIGITVRILYDLKQQNSDESQIVLGASVIDDVLGIILLSVLYEFSMGGGVSIFNIGKILIFILLYLILSPITARLISGVIKHYESKSDIPGLLPSTIIASILFFAWLASIVSAPPLLGGFAAGLALSKQFRLPFAQVDINEKFLHRVEQQMKPIIHLFVPIFFVEVGLSLNLREIQWDSSFIWTFSLSILLAAVIGKLASGFLLFKENKWVKWAVGLAMIPRGEVGLIFAEVGRKINVFTQDLYATMIIVITVTTIFTPILMRYFYSYKQKIEAQTEI